MNLPEFSVKNSLFVNMLSAVLIIAGMLSLFHMKREAFPPVSFNVVIVTTFFRGADSEKVERLVTTPLEKEIKDVDGIEEMVSSSNSGVSEISLKISDDVANKEKVVNDIQRAVDKVTNLPADVDERPVVTEITSGQIPVIKIALSGEVNEFELRRYTDNLKDILESINGVSSLKRTGWRDEEFWVQPDINKMFKFHISFSELATALKRQNIDLPGGKLRTKTKEFTVKVNADFKNKKDIEDTVIRANDLGNEIRVKDIASVKHTFQDDIVMNEVLASRAITLIVVKRDSGDILDIVKNVNRAIAAFREKCPPAIKISTFYDMSCYVKRRLHVLKSNGWIGFILVLIVLFLFLDPIPALMTALGIPIAMLTTFMVMDFIGLDINLITMFGLIMVLGMVVDDGIIISENTCRHIEQGLSPQKAAVVGTQEVMLPVLATVLTTIAAFSPLMFMKGLIGQFVRYIPFVAIIALIASLLEAFVILPSHLSDFASPIGRDKVKSEKRWFKAMLRNYKRLLNFSVRNRYKIVSLISVLFIISILYAKHYMPFILFSAKGVEQFSIRLEAKSGTSLEQTNRLIKPVEEIIESMPKKYVDTYETAIGELKEERGYDPNAKKGSNFAQINVYLTPSEKRDKTAKEIINSMRPSIQRIFKKLKPKGVVKLYFQAFKEGPPVGRDVDVRVRGTDLSKLKIIAGKIEDYLKAVKGVYSITDSYDMGSLQINIIIDENKAARAYLTNSDIAFAVRCAFSGGLATTIKQSKAEKEIRVLVRLPENQRNKMGVFNKILVRNKFDNLVPLLSVAKITHSNTLRSINHLNGKRFISVTADVNNRNITSVTANDMVKTKFKDIGIKYPGYSLYFSGENKEMRKSMASLRKAFLIAILVIFLIIATLFKSLFQPFIVMLTIPFAFIGVIFAFSIQGEPLSFFAILGMVGLCGIVINDSIVLVDFINRLRSSDRRRPIKDIVREAAVLRLRPVILTTITTIAGLGTVAYGIGGSDPFLKPMALAISWGLLFSTFLTLIVIPCAYMITDDIKKLYTKRKN